MIDLRSYNHKAARTLQDFVYHNAVFHFAMIPRGQPAVEHPHMMQFREKSATWTSWVNDADLLENDQATLPREAYNEYKRLLEDQEAILAAGNFTRIVAAAFTRMPLAESLLFSDDDFISENSPSMWESMDVSRRIGDRKLFGGNRPRWWLGKTDAERALVYFSLLPSSWDVSHVFNLDVPATVALLHQVPGTIQKGLLDLHINLSRPEYFLNLVAPCGEELSALTHSISKLETFVLLQPNTSLCWGFHSREIERSGKLKIQEYSFAPAVHGKDLHQPDELPMNYLNYHTHGASKLTLIS